MKGIILLAVLLVGCVVEGHLWLRTPLSRGGLNDIGGTTNFANPTCNRAATTKPTAYEVGASVNFQFRANVHGPGPFSYYLYQTNPNKKLADLKVNLTYKVTSVDGFDGFTTPITIPNQICDACYVMLIGMASSTGGSPWINCADVKIAAAGSLGIPSVSSISPTSGPTTGGTTITVTGTNFATGSKCIFDNVEVPATFVSSTQVSCKSPPRNQPSISAVEVLAPNGKVSSSGVPFNFTGSVILPIISSIDPKSGPPGTRIVISGQNFFSSEVMCNFTPTNGKTITQIAQYVSQTQVTCTVPTVNTNVNLNLEVTVDGSEASKSGIAFSATITSATSTLSPSLSWLGILSFFVVFGALFA